MSTTTHAEAFAALKHIIDHCREQQERQGKPDAFVTFHLPGKWGDRTHARMFGKLGGPKGQILSDDFNRPGQIIVGFRADEVIAGITKKLEALA